MYLTITYVNSNRKRYITLPESITVSETQLLVSTLSVCPGVDKVWINFTQPGTSKDEKTDNSNPTT